MGEVRTKTVYIAEDDSEHATFEAATAQNEFVESIREANHMFFKLGKELGDTIADTGCYTITEEQRILLNSISRDSFIGDMRVCWFEPGGIHLVSAFGNYNINVGVDTVCRSVANIGVAYFTQQKNAA